MSLLLGSIGLAAVTGPARADEPKEFAGGYPEPVVQWGVNQGETCEDIARATYGDPKYAYLLLRYNRLTCTRGAPLKPGITLVLPAKVTEIAAAHIRSLNPSVKAKAPGGAWAPAASGEPLSTNSNVSTEENARADIQFADRTRVFLAENTLVIIYGTASQTAVAKNPPPKVELDQGEVKAALSALAGGDVDQADEEAIVLALKGGGRVSASSKDAVIQRKETRTTVAVFNGKAKVENAGHAVDVPTNFGTRFVGPKPPDPPRPLPPAPDWVGSSSGVALGLKGQSILRGAWNDVPKAKSYRIEVATDANFEKLVIREEVAATVKDFRIEKLPIGTYFSRVRAIDTEEYLGIASTPLQTSLVEVSFKQGSGKFEFKGTTETLQVSRDAILAFEPAPEITIGSGKTMTPLPRSLDLGSASTTELSLLAPGNAGPTAISVVFDPLPEVAVVAPPVVVVKPIAERPKSRIGVSAPGFSLNAQGVPLWWAPTADNQVSLGAVVEGGFDGSTSGVGGRLYSTAQLGPVGFELGVRSNAIADTRPADEGGTFGLRLRLIGGKKGDYELGPAARVDFPISAGGQPVRVEGGFALGREVGPWSWLVDVGTRIQAQDKALGAVAVPFFAIGGGSLQLTPWLRAQATLDVEVNSRLLALPCPSGTAPADCNSESLRPAAGASVGLEAGTSIFGAVVGRVSPFDSSYRGISAEAMIGFRADPLTPASITSPR